MSTCYVVTQAKHGEEEGYPDPAVKGSWASGPGLALISARHLASAQLTATELLRGRATPLQA